MSIPKTTEEVRSNVQEIGQALRAGTISNAVARTLLQEAKVTLDSLKLEMEAARLGCTFRAVSLNEADRNNGLRRVA